MESNKSIVNAVTTEFLLRLGKQKVVSELTLQMGLLLGKKEKPKAEDFIKIYESHTSKGDTSE